MFTRVGLERILVSAAIFLSLFPSWRYRPVFFTVSDLVFCFSLLTIVLTRGLPRAPFGMLTPYWFAGFALLMASLVGSSLINGEPTRAVVVCSQYAFSLILLPMTIMGRDREATINLVQVFALGVFVANWQASSCTIPDTRETFGSSRATAGWLRLPEAPTGMPR